MKLAFIIPLKEANTIITGEKSRWKISNIWNNIAVKITIGFRIF
jgi:hypothetical protein